MHVGIYTECLTKRYTGVEVMAHRLVEEISKTNKVTCFHTKNKTHPLFTNVKHHLFRRSLPIPAYNQLASFFRMNCFNKVDLLHLPHPHVPFVKMPSIPVVMTVHDIIPAFHPEFHNTKRSFYFKHILPGFIRKMDAILASSETTKTDLITHYRLDEQKIHVVPLALPEKKNVVRTPQEFILYLGTLEPRKNVDGIIKAYSLLRKQGITHKLVIAGGMGWNYEHIFKLVRQSGLENEVIFKGYVDEDEKRRLYQTAALFVWPSFYEGFGLPVLEAMQYGVPVVTSTASSLAEIAADSALLADPHSPESIADAMSAALEPVMQKKLSRKGIERARLFTIDNYVKKTIDVYSKVAR
ncbi:glycosyltransferase family 4 protein [Candidatus Woesearchaeota archaeon]|nr:glycosyltransferase family 4 protein [Candidatus Woesearchaeota archaeon]